jgi:hypothetical protein
MFPMGNRWGRGHSTLCAVVEFRPVTNVVSKHLEIETGYFVKLADHILLAPPGAVAVCDVNWSGCVSYPKVSVTPFPSLSPVKRPAVI